MWRGRRPASKPWAARSTHVGEQGAGQTVKLSNQILCVVNMLAAGEALLFAKAGGVDLEKMLQAVTGGAAGSWMLANRGPQVINDYWEPGFSIDLQQKDLRLVIGAADKMGVPVIATALCFNLYRTLQAQGMGGEGNHGDCEGAGGDGGDPGAAGVESKSRLYSVPIQSNRYGGVEMFKPVLIALLLMAILASGAQDQEPYCQTDHAFATADAEGIQFDLLCQPLLPETIELDGGDSLRVVVNLEKYKSFVGKDSVRFRLHFAIDHGRLKIKQPGSIAQRELTDSGGDNLRDIEIQSDEDQFEVEITGAGIFRGAKFDLAVWPGWGE